MADWDTRWMNIAKEVATWSKDHHRQVGAVIVRDRKEMVVHGYNGFPKKVNDHVEDRYTRPIKYKWMIHAEKNALLKSGNVEGCTIYSTCFPCAQCAGAIVQKGIACVVAPRPNWDDPTLADDFRVAAEMFNEVGVEIRFVEDIND